ncbi:MAG: endolytic transglycosylase MltG [Brevefilum sp.]|nr:endolytic transglycosylase MltG [Brevefilum sp.]MDT8380875.1 endolytic transglycosylase MltG [Brevefilum sp.]MDW7754873.1 endolytic transglycosylase MltG [Brevefilum sp.]
MAKKRKARILPLFILLFLLIFAGLIVGVFSINQVITSEFGKPTKNLSLTQRILYPIELFLRREALTKPKNSSGVDQPFTIAQGESVSIICIRLEQSGLIEDAELLRTYLVYTGLDRQLQSGQFVLNPAMSSIQIASALMDATPSEAVVSILPGWRIEEVAANIAGSGLAISREEFISESYTPSSEYFSYLPIDNSPTLEGFLFPGMYMIPREESIAYVLREILSEFSANMDEDLLNGFERQGLSIYEAVALASIVEKEAVVDDEKPLIASVFYNRLAQGMRLETDPTVQYALGFSEEWSTWWKSPLSNADLAVESPYNTYLAFGLPPTPICNPDLGSLRAVAFPAETPYLYFRAACDGSGRHNFSITFEEHLNNACD